MCESIQNGQRFLGILLRISLKIDLIFGMDEDQILEKAGSGHPTRVANGPSPLRQVMHLGMEVRQRS